MTGQSQRLREQELDAKRRLLGVTIVHKQDPASWDGQGTCIWCRLTLRPDVPGIKSRYHAEFYVNARTLRCIDVLNGEPSKEAE